ncbi:MAG: hypothetical protein ACI915_005602 [Gammaproteobacteria bacterium]
MIPGGNEYSESTIEKPRRFLALSRAVSFINFNRSLVHTQLLGNDVEMHLRGFITNQVFSLETAGSNGQCNSCFLLAVIGALRLSTAVLGVFFDKFDDLARYVDTSGLFDALESRGGVDLHDDRSVV